MHLNAQAPLPELIHSVNVGITGHRNIPTESRARIEAAISMLLTFIKEAANDIRQSESHKAFLDKFSPAQSVRLHILSQLAEGLDRIAAHKGIEAGYKLQTILPMQQDAYMGTFEPNEEANQDFYDLLEKSDNIVEIACSNNLEGQAYADASRMMLAHSDILLAVWNGKKTEYIAGTYATMQASKRLRVPIICIPSQTHNDGNDSIPTDCIAFVSESDVELFKISTESNNQAEFLRRRIRTYLETTMLPRTIRKGEKNISPYEPQEGEPSTHTPESNQHGKSSGNKWYKKFEEFIHGAKKPPVISARETESHGEEKEIIEKHRTNNQAYWHQFYKYYNEEAIPYADIYRNRLFLRNLLPVIAVLALTIAVNADWLLDIVPEHALNNYLKWGMYLAQITAWIWVFILVWQEVHRDVKTHFYSYRAIAEHCRLSPFLWAVGYSNAKLGTAPSESKNSHTDSIWYYRLLTRNAVFFPDEKGGKRITLSKQRISAWLAWIKNDFLIDQLKYHTSRVKRIKKLQERLKDWAFKVYLIGTTAVLIRGILHFLKDTNSATFDDWHVITVAIAFSLPTIAAFLSSYDANSGFSAQRNASQDMQNKLDSLIKEAENLYHQINNSPSEHDSPEDAIRRQILDSEVSYTHILDFCERTSGHCLEELHDWVNTSTGNLNRLL